MQSTIIIHLPPIIRHEQYFVSLGEQLANLGYSILYLCLDADYAFFWKQRLEYSVLSPQVIPSLDLLDAKLECFLEKGNRNHDLALTEEIILDVQNSQAPHSKFSKRQLGRLVHSTLHCLDNELSKPNHVIFFNNSSAMDVYNITFTYAASWYDKEAILMDYSPIEGFEITFSKLIQKNYLKAAALSKKEEILKKDSVSRFMKNEQYVDANNAYFETRKSQKRYLFKRASKQYWFMIKKKPLSLLKSILHFRVKRNIYSLLNLFCTILFDKKLKRDMNYNYVFIGSSSLESYQKLVFSKNNFITEIIKFRKNNPKSKFLYKPHPVSKSEEILFFDLLRLKLNRIDITFDKLTVLQVVNVGCCVGVSSSVLVKSIISGIQTKSLFRGIHNEFGVQKIKYLDEANLQASNKNENIDPRLFFKGKQRHYLRHEVEELVTSTVQVIRAEIRGQNDT